MLTNVLFPFIGSEMGGSHVSAFTLAETLKAAGRYQPIILAAQGTLIANEATARGLKVVYSGEAPSTRHRYNPGYDLVRAPSRLRLAVGLGKQTLIHCNDIGALQSWGPIGKACGQKVLYHSRSLHKGMSFNKWLMSLTNHIICISDVTFAQFGDLDAKRVSHVVNPFSISMDVDRLAARAKLIDELDLPNSAKLVGFIGNLWQRKRPSFFLQAAKEIAGSVPDAYFVFFGRDGDQTISAVRAEAMSLDLANRTRFAGFRLPVESNLAAIDLAMFPAVREPFGRALVEALILGTPFVASDDAGHGEIVRRWGGGLLAPIDATASEFARLAERALLNPQAASLNLQQRRKVAEEVSPEGHAQRIVAIYDSIV